LLTPDGSGITMWFITIPLIVLYIAGLAVIKFDSMLPTIDQNQRYQ
jgi:sec-independent protein translocase protein TatC